MKTILISIVIALALIGGVFLLKNKNNTLPTPIAESNVSVIDSKQIVEINAKGGYSPERSIAQAGISTILRIDTKGTFDCSSSIRIPAMNISKVLPQTGTTDIDLGIQPSGIFKGTCGMGMYPFEIEFQN